ncbi:hypothetical protein GC176_01945 [bacterium]|nr:hypothetical protein [bacterium]
MRGLIHSPSASRSTVLELAETISQLGITLHQGFSKTAAVREYESGLNLLGITADFIQTPGQIPDEGLAVEGLRIAAKLLSDRGLSLRQLGNSESALESRCAARELRQRLVNRFPLRLEDRLALVISHWNLSDTLFDFPDRDAEIASWRTCLRELEPLLAAAPDDERYREVRCIASTRLSQTLWRSGRRDEALDEFHSLLLAGFEPEAGERWNSAQQVLVAGLYAQLSLHAEFTQPVSLPVRKSGQQSPTTAVLPTSPECLGRALACLTGVRHHDWIRSSEAMQQLTDPEGMFKPLQNLQPFQAFLADIGIDATSAEHRSE